MAMKIVILEDNNERQAAMEDCLNDRFYQFQVKFFDDALAMIRFLGDFLSDTIAISLDHDLELKPSPSGTMIDPGTGREVAEFLAHRSPACPVVIHSTNSEAASGMEMVLQDAQWDTYRVYPGGDLEWISGQWFRTIRNAIVESAKTRP